MDETKLQEYIDQHRWLLNNGLVGDDVKNQLFFCGSIVHKDVQAVEVDITPENKVVSYRIYVDRDLLKKIDKYHRLSRSTGLVGMWLFKRFLVKNGSLDFSAILKKFVKDFCGPKWTAEVEVKDFGTYVENVGTEDEKARTDK
jgi:hypothetical protein